MKSRREFLGALGLGAGAVGLGFPGTAFAFGGRRRRARCTCACQPTSLCPEGGYDSRPLLCTLYCPQYLSTYANGIYYYYCMCCSGVGVATVPSSTQITCLPVSCPGTIGQCPGGGAT